ncbi:MAG: ORC1-type DNA replication protein [Candidatus Woesearchaeota archaeon]|nr:ORC1-type DNA replication protein [Candidatus Woesearchaeota archaeon]
MTQNHVPAGNLFEKFLSNNSLFINKNVLQSSYLPNTIPHREEQIRQIRDIIGPALRREKPSNLFIYGQTGTGKTVTLKYTADVLMKFANEKNILIKIVYLNCKMKKVADTEYRLVAQLAREFGKEIPATGLPTDEVYKIFFSVLDREKQTVILILDEIDQLIDKAGEELLYNLTRINEELKHAQVSIIGITNRISFGENMDPRVKSSLSEEEILFPPYNALQLQNILFQRAKNAFKPNVLGEGVIEKCSAYAAKEHGDARRALELLRVSGEIAERKEHSKVAIEDVDEADSKIEKDRVLDIVEVQPKEFQATLYAIIRLAKNKKISAIYTGDVYELYRGICKETNLRPLTQRRVSDIIGELDMQGIINAKVISKGRQGRTREISFSIPPETAEKVEKIIRDSLGI